MDNDTIKIEKLQSAEQFSLWKFQVRVLLNANELYEFVNGENKLPCKLRTETASDFNSRLKIWRKGDNQAQKIIVTTLGKGPLQHIVNCNSSQEMWEKLETVYEQKSTTYIHLLQQRFYSFSKAPADDMATHISKLESMVRQLRDSGETISDAMIVTKLLMTLPASYNHFYSAWESTPVEQRTLGNLTARLIMEETRQTQQQQPTHNSENAFVVSQAAKKQNSYQKQSQNKRIQFRGKCFLCGERGHWKKNCPSKKTKTDNSVSLSKLSVCEQHKGEALLCDTFFDLSKNDIWCLDSGATDHMTSRREWLVNFTMFEQPVSVKVGNGSIILAMGKGDINILAYDGKEWNEKYLSNVLYVPDITMNLFSQSSALDKGFTLESDKEKCVFKNKERVVAVGARRGKLFHMCFRVTSSESVTGNLADKQDSLKLWHDRLCHQNFDHVRSVLKDNMIKFRDDNVFCEECMAGKQHRLKFTKSESSATHPGQLVHADLCGPMETDSYGGCRYFLLFKDDFSSFRVVYFLRSKSEVPDLVQKYVYRVKIETEFELKTLRTDNGLEFINNKVGALLEKNSVRHERSVPYTPQQNGRAERDLRTIVEAARTMLHSKNLNKNLWAEAVNHAVYILNRTGPTKINNKSPISLWCGRNFEIRELKVFGSSCFVHIPKEKRKKWDKKCEKGLFVGYSENTKGYRVWIPRTRKVEISRDVVFNENSTYDCDSQQNNEWVAGPQDNCEKNQSSEFLSKFECENSETEANSQVTDNLTYPVKPIERFAFAVDCEPKTYEEAISCENSDKWKVAMDEEISSLLKNHTWILTELPPNTKVTSCKWIYKIKPIYGSSKQNFKARLVARGYQQEYGIDYEETFSPVVKFSSLRVILSFIAANNLKMRQFDIKTAFLYGDLDEDIYMSQPDGYNDGSGKVCKLQRSLYGLKQAPRCWNRKFSKILGYFDLQCSDADPCVFVRNSKRRLILAIYVDDGLVAADNEEDIIQLFEYLNGNFDVKVIDVHCFLGIELIQLDDGSIFISQETYARKILKKYGMDESKSVATPSETSSVEKVNVMAERYPFREVVGSLMYLAVGTRPDIAYSVGLLSRCLDRPTPADVVKAKRVLRYLNGTKSYGILYKHTLKFSMNVYSDADYAGDLSSRRSTSGYAVMISEGAVSWSSQLQRSVSLSTTEAEFIAASEAVKELIWLQKLVNDISPMSLIKPKLFMDNQGAIRLIKNFEFHKRSKHIDVRYHFVREKFQEKMFELLYVCSENQIADILTKSVLKTKFEKLRKSLGVLSRPEKC